MDKIGLIEDDDVLRNAYQKFFEKTQTFEVVFSAPDIAEALELKTITPAIILLDVSLRSGSGIDSIKLLMERFPNTKVVILSSMEDAKLTRLAIENGATGYLLKTSSLPYIAESLLKINDGGIPFSPVTMSHVMAPKGSENNEDATDFTKRELELIKLLSEGVANKTAADKLNVTYFTINQHLKNIYKKLNINSKAELISWYLNKWRN